MSREGSYPSKRCPRQSGGSRSGNDAGFLGRTLVDESFDGADMDACS